MIYYHLILILFLFAKSVYGKDTLCKFEIPDGQYIDLRNTPIFEVDLSGGKCGEKHHKLKINLCQNLDVGVCKSDVTEGPSNACDFFDSGKDDNVYWVGGIENYAINHYDTGERKVEITYEGIIQTKEHPFWTRSVTLSLKCGPETKTSCISIDNEFSKATTMYNIELTTPDGCPIAEPRRIIGLVIVVFVFVFTAFVAVGYVCLSIGAGLTLLSITCAMVAGSSFFLEFGKSYLEKLEKKKMKRTGVTIDDQESSGEELDLDIAPLLEDDVKKNENE